MIGTLMQYEPDAALRFYQVKTHQPPFQERRRAGEDIC